MVLPFKDMCRGRFWWIQIWETWPLLPKTPRWVTLGKVDKEVFQVKKLSHHPKLSSLYLMLLVWIDLPRATKNVSRSWLIHNPQSIIHFFVLGHPPVICGNPGKMKSAKIVGELKRLLGSNFQRILADLTTDWLGKLLMGTFRGFEFLFQLHLRPSQDLYRPENIIGNDESSGNCYAKAFHTEGPDLADRCLEMVRKESLSCEHHELMMWHRGNGSFHFGWDEVTTSQLSNPRLPKVLAHPFYINGVRWVKYGSSIFSSSSSWYDVQSPID